MSVSKSMWVKISLVAALFFIVIIAAAPAAGLSPLELREGQAVYALTPHMEILENAASSWDLHDVSTGRQTSGFQPVKDEKIIIKYENRINWFRFSVTGLQADARWWLTTDYPFFFELALYGPVFSDRGSEQPPAPVLKLAGLDHHLGSSRIHYRLPTLPIKPAGEGVYYLRTISRSMTPIQFRIVETASFANQAFYHRMIFGICYGIMLCMLFYNLFICLSLRSLTYLYYVLYIFCLLIASFFLYGHMGELLDIPGNLYMRLMWLFAGGFTFWAMTFIRSFLSTSKNAPILDKIVLAAMLYGVVMSILGLLGLTKLAWYLGFFSSIASPLIGFATGLSALKRGVRGASYFLLAWGIFIAGILIFSLDMAGILPDWSFLKQSLLMGSAFESTFLSLALADRIRTLREEKVQLQKKERQLQYLSQTDGLTGLYNKRYLLGRLETEIELAEPDPSLCLVMMDVDNFKIFNDTYGHVTGDQVLKELAGTIVQNVRAMDACCRFGGEEFAVIMPQTNLADAFQAAERIRSAFADLVIEYEGSRLRATISLGLAGSRSGSGVQDLIDRADQALYQAKGQGKNKTVASE